MYIAGCILDASSLKMNVMREIFIFERIKQVEMKRILHLKGCYCKYDGRMFFGMAWYLSDVMGQLRTISLCQAARRISRCSVDFHLTDVAACPTSARANFSEIGKPFDDRADPSLRFVTGE